MALEGKLFVNDPSKFKACESGMELSSGAVDFSTVGHLSFEVGQDLIDIFGYPEYKVGRVDIVDRSLIIARKTFVIGLNEGAVWVPSIPTQICDKMVRPQESLKVERPDSYTLEVLNTDPVVEFSNPSDARVKLLEAIQSGKMLG